MKEVTMTIQDIQKVSLDILKKVAQICDEQGIKYFLAYGTLLGAIRHKGYIPWDDDVDIMMVRPEYEKFLSYMYEHEEEYRPLELLNMQTRKNYPHMITRVSDSRYRLKVTNERDYGLGIFIDIYVIDGIGNTEEEAWKTMRKCCKYPSMIFLSTRKYYHFGNTKGWIKRLLKIPAFVFTHIMGKGYFVGKLNKILSTLDYDNSKYVGCAAWDEISAVKVMKKEWIEDLIKVPYEDSEFYIPKHYDEILKVNYGDYMQLPPKEERIMHHLYKAYKVS